MLLRELPFHDMPNVAVNHMDPLGNRMACIMPVLAHRNPSTMEWATVRPSVSVNLTVCERGGTI